MYWTPRGRVWEGVSPCQGGYFLEIWVLNTGVFLCIIKFELTSTLYSSKKPPKCIYDFSTRGGGHFHIFCPKYIPPLSEFSHCFCPKFSIAFARISGKAMGNSGKSNGKIWAKAMRKLGKRRHIFRAKSIAPGGGGGALNYTAVHTRDHRFFEPTLSKFYPLVKFIPYSSIFAGFFWQFCPLNKYNP